MFAKWESPAEAAVTARRTKKGQANLIISPFYMTDTLSTGGYGAGLGKRAATFLRLVRIRNIAVR